MFMCLCIWRKNGNIRCLPLTLPTMVLRQALSPNLRDHQFDRTSCPISFNAPPVSGSPVYIDRLKFWLELCWLKFGFHLCSKHFTDWTTTPALIIIFEIIHLLAVQFCFQAGRVPVSGSNRQDDHKNSLNIYYMVLRENFSNLLCFKMWPMDHKHQHRLEITLGLMNQIMCFKENTSRFTACHIKQAQATVKNSCDVKSLWYLTDSSMACDLHMCHFT